MNLIQSDFLFWCYYLCLCFVDAVRPLLQHSLRIITRWQYKNVIHLNIYRNIFILYFHLLNWLSQVLSISVLCYNIFGWQITGPAIFIALDQVLYWMKPEIVTCTCILLVRCSLFFFYFKTIFVTCCVESFNAFERVSLFLWII